MTLVPSRLVALCTIVPVSFFARPVTAQDATPPPGETPAEERREDAREEEARREAAGHEEALREEARREAAEAEARERAAASAALPAAAGGTCIGSVYASARPAILRVESGLAVGAGFLALDASHAVTSLSLVADGHSVRVVDVEGNARSARVVAAAGDDDLALLELASPLGAEPLPIADWEAIDVGREVVVATFASGRTRRGRHGDDEFELGLVSGAINATGDRGVQVDAHPAAVGSPIVDCDGRVVGVAARRMMLTDDPFTYGAAANAVADLLTRADRPESHGGRVRLVMGLGLSLAWEDAPPAMEPDMLGGGYLEVGITALDSFVLAARGHFLMGSTEPTGSDVLRRDGQRFRVDAYAGWRQLVSFGGGMGFHFELALGASVNMLRDETRRIATDAAGGLVFLDSAAERWRVRPLAMATIELGWFVVSYQVELELEDRGRIDSGGGHAYHLWTVGFQN